MNSHELRAALEEIEHKVGEVSDGLTGSKQPKGDKLRWDELRSIVREIQWMRRDLDEGQWEGRSIEGYPIGTDDRAIVDEAPKTG
jgi:hypothetical protein